MRARPNEGENSILIRCPAHSTNIKHLLCNKQALLGCVNTSRLRLSLLRLYNSSALTSEQMYEVFNETFSNGDEEKESIAFPPSHHPSRSLVTRSFVNRVRTLSYGCTRKVWRTREKRFMSALQTSQVHPYLDIRTLKHEPIVFF